MPNPASSPQMQSPAMTDEHEQPAMMFHKTKSNNFFAVDDSQDQIQPFDDDADDYNVDDDRDRPEQSSHDNIKTNNDSNKAAARRENEGQESTPRPQEAP